MSMTNYALLPDARLYPVNPAWAFDKCIINKTNKQHGGLRSVVIGLTVRSVFAIVAYFFRRHSSVFVRSQLVRVTTSVHVCCEHRLNVDVTENGAQSKVSIDKHRHLVRKKPNPDGGRNE